MSWFYTVFNIPDPGPAFNGHCDGGYNVSSQKISAEMPNTVQIGTLSETPNTPKMTYVDQEKLDLTKCKYTPSSTTTNLPTKTVDSISRLYNLNKFTVNNITVNNSCNKIPRGIIIAWYGGDKIPNGWVICDGTNCTPDLRGRSIYGYDSIGNKNKIGQMGGEESHVLNIAEIPQHMHNYALSSGSTRFLTGADGSNPSRFGAKSVNAIGSTTYLNDSKNLPHNNMPPFTVCTYIMKL